MSLKNLFNNTQNVSVLSSVTKEDLSQNIESEDYIDVYLKNKDKFVPDIDFSQPSNFAKFGLAEEYYVRAIESIYNTYPYDGSKKEKIEWELSASHLEKSLFDLEYPKTTGYARFGISSYSGTGSNGYSSGSAEYILTKGGPNLGPDSTRVGANIYDLSNQRECNLKIDGESGNTIEFWLKKDSFNPSNTATEVIFDNWTTSSASGSSDYGRMRLEMSASTGSPFYFTYMSGTSGFDKAQISSSLTTASIADGNWHHYCVRVKNSGANIQTDLFVDGNYESTYLVAGDVQYVSGTFVSTIGALNTAPSGTTIPQRGWGKLSGSIDELRFWKTWRTSKEIERNWFDQVGGGTNTDTANTELGIYYKFNEGITGTSSVDSVVLDYSGRISNGTWVGYDSTSSRSTGSAFNEYTGMTLTEFEDPIIYSDHPDVVSLIETKRNLGREWDVRNAGSLYKSMPSWIVEEHESSATNQDENSLVALTQIMGSYFDTIAAQIDTIPKIKQNGYMSSSAKPYPFYNRLLESEGFKVPELFDNASVYEFFNNRTDEKLFEEKLYNVKNLIYQNLYNNLLSIYKSKGTEKGLRNVLRCFGIDNEIYKLNIYSKDHTFELKDNFVSDTIKKKFVNFNTVENSDAVVYQWQDSTNSESKSFISGSQNFTSGSEGQGLALSFETEIIFPKRYDIGEFNTYLSGASAYSKTYPLMLSSSLFGMHTAKTTENDLTWNTNDYANFQVYAIKDDQFSNRGYFLLTSSAGGFLSTITSSYINDLYEDSRWNFVVSLYPSSYSQASLISGSYNDYTVEFRGFKKTLDNTDDSFVVSSSVSNANGQKILASNKRIYLGAHKTNFTGSTLTSTDVKISTAKVYYTKLESSELENHAEDSRMIGQTNPHQSAFTYQQSLTGVFVPKIDSLVLHWDFDQVTGSDSSGQFISQDLTSGSASIRSRYGSWYGNILGYQYTARGDFFETSSSNVVKDEDVFIAKKQLPEYVYSSEMVNVLSEDDTNFNIQKRPTSYFMLLEKSMYQNISEEMLKYLNTVIDFNTLIGEPVSRYRESYKGLERLRTHFFERIGNIPDIEKYIEYYKWLDTAVTVAISQTTPASSNLSEEHVRNIIESHIFERNKYRYNFPLFSNKRNENIESTSKGIGEMGYNWKYGHYSANSYENALWQRDRKEASTSDLQKIKDVITSKNDSAILIFSGTSGPYSGSVYEFRALGETSKISVGLEDKKAINTSFYKPLVMLGSGTFGIILDLTNTGSEITTDYSDLGVKKKLVNVKASILQDTSSVYRSQDVIPFTLMSSSTSPYYTVENNLRDVYSDYKNEPLQSPFTEKHVGGNQVRHIYREFNSEYTTRPEAYEIRVSGSYIYIGSPKSTTATKQQYSYFRDEVAKRPVNIRNIPILTSSLTQGGTTIGNFSKTYEIVSVSGRTANNRYFVRNEGISISSSYSPAISGVVDYGLVDTTVSGNYGNPVIVSRFSPLGSPETDSEGYLDCIAREYSIYSTVNWRNLGIRSYADLWAQQACGQFGYDSVVVGITLPSTMTGTYENSASFHKVNRNRERRITESSSAYVTASKYDNDFVQHQIPRSDKQYTWINDSITNDIFGFEQPNFLYASQASTDITHFSQSLYVSAYKFLDLAGMSTFVHETYNPLTMLAQYETSNSPVGNFNSDYNHALITHQNGLNSWPTWKQLRGNAMSRYIANRNILYFVNERDEKTIVIEPSVSTRHKSLDFNVDIELDNKTAKQILYSIPFGSIISKFSDHTYFSSNETEVDFSKFFKENTETKEYKQIKSLIKSDIPKSINPIKSLNYIKYKEQIYPKEQFVTIYRGRDNFTSSFWKSSRTDRSVTGSTNYMNNSVTTGSAWILDSRLSFDSGSSYNTASQLNTQGEGELQNNNTIFHLGSKDNLKLDVLYSRRNEEFVSGGSIYAGDTKWEAASQAGVEPAYNSYADYIEDLRRLGKDYNIIPEFRISEHMDYYVNEKYGNFLQDNVNLFTITGSVLSSSSDSDFYKKYSTTDFLKYFDIVKNDFDDVLKTGELTLKCKAIKRFIPYDGFYPAQRTAQLAGLFKDSYSGSLIATGADSTASAAYRPVFQPLFAPGIMYNTIKSSLAVDYPVYTAPYTVTGSISSSDGGIPRLASDFDYRVPFEAILEPEVYLKGKRILDQEPHPSASLNVTASLVGVGSEAYKLATNNFMAESINMFLKNGSLTTFASAPDNDSQYFNVTAGKKYVTRLVCSHATYRSVAQILDYVTDYGTGSLLSQSYEYNPPTIKMYENAGSGSGKNAKKCMWGSAFGQPIDTGPSAVFGEASASYKAFTPPYYGGYSHIELTYNATGSGRVSTSEVLSSITASTLRYDELVMYLQTSSVDYINRMQLTASMNYKQVAFEKNVKFDSLGNPIEIDGTNQSSRWVIQPKFETPVLDFTSSAVTLPVSGSSSINIGMWHQYGQIPNEANKGLFLEIQDLDSSEITSSDLTGSLADLVGFRKGSQKIGQIKEEQIISEAIIAVPFFVNSHGSEERFPISRQVIENAELYLDGQKNQFDLNVSVNPENKPSEQIIKMVENMRKFVIPPRMNFLEYKQITPFTMYIFKFDTKLVQPDLAKIWQNLPPTCADKFEQDEQTISHSLFQYNKELGTEMLNGFDSKVQWLVFKAKQKASWNYYEKTADSKDDSRFKFKFNNGTEESKLGTVPKYSYNWPYDFCSIVELGKIEAEVKLIPKDNK